jgi:WXG100 family type VII secretion target
MADRIKLSPEELRTSAGKYAEGSEGIEQILSDLTREQAVICENWEGDSFASFDEQFTELSPKIQQFAELLQDIREQLFSVAEIIEQTDADIAAQIRR